MKRIVGLPNVGKSTLFNCLSNERRKVQIFRFALIEPNIGVVNVPDQRLEKLEKLVNPEKGYSRYSRNCRHCRTGKGASKRRRFRESIFS